MVRWPGAARSSIWVVRRILGLAVLAFRGDRLVSMRQAKSGSAQNRHFLPEHQQLAVRSDRARAWPCGRARHGGRAGGPGRLGVRIGGTEPVLGHGADQSFEPVAYCLRGAIPAGLDEAPTGGAGARPRSQQIRRRRRGPFPQSCPGGRCRSEAGQLLAELLRVSPGRDFSTCSPGPAFRTQRGRMLAP